MIASQHLYSTYVCTLVHHFMGGRPPGQNSCDNLTWPKLLQQATVLFSLTGNKHTPQISPMTRMACLFVCVCVCVCVCEHMVFICICMLCVYALLMISYCPISLALGYGTQRVMRYCMCIYIKGLRSVSHIYVFGS